MSETDEKIFDSPASAPDDDFWLAHGRQMVSESLPAVRAAAQALITALGLLQAIYLGILGFANFLPAQMSFQHQSLFVLPLLLWLGASYCCVKVMLTRKLTLSLHAPEDIRRQATAVVLEKQRQLSWAFWLLAIGLLLVFGLFVLRLAWKT